MFKRWVYMSPEGGGEGGGNAGNNGGTPGGGGNDGGNSNAFLSQLPEEYRTNPSLQSFKDLPSLVKSYVHAQSMVGADKVVIPKADAKPEDWGQVYDKLGRPKVPDEYNLTDIENLPEAYKKEGDNKAFKAYAHSLGLNNTQANNLYQFLQNIAVEHLTTTEQNNKQALEAATETAKKEWGKNFDVEVARAKAAVKQFGGDEFAKYIDESGLGNDPRFLKFAHNVAKAMSEDSAFFGRAANQGFASGPEHAKAEIAKLQTDSAFMQAYIGGEKAAVDRMSSLMATAYS